jgi:hypothetical protein
MPVIPATQAVGIEEPKTSPYKNTRAYLKNRTKAKRAEGMVQVWIACLANRRL